MLKERAHELFGESVADLKLFLKDHVMDHLDDFKEVQCSCGHNGWTLFDEGGEFPLMVECQKCEKHFFVLDSAEIAGEGLLEEDGCPKCDSSESELAIGYELNEKKLVSFISIAARCKTCGIVGEFAAWEVDNPKMFDYQNQILNELPDENEESQSNNEEE